VNKTIIAEGKMAPREKVVKCIMRI